MPYIKKEDRPFYDEMIARMLQDDNGFSENDAKALAQYILPKDIMDHDGHMNYFLTKLFTMLNGLHAKISVGTLKCFIITVLCELYQPKYFNYNRAMGMLTCVKKEYERRHGSRKAFLVKSFIDGVMETFYTQVIGPYEDKKIAENGDVE